jgi:glycosyltransferase involved in cell wall biosynthesis
MASPNHFRRIYDVLYVYDDKTPLNDHNVRYQLQWDLGKSVYSMPNYAPLDRSEAEKQKRIVIVTASYQNAERYLWNLDSVFEQHYENWHLIYVDDCSPDGTGELVEKYVELRAFKSNVTVIRNETRKKALANLYSVIHTCAPDDIIVLLDGDDRLASWDVLKEVNRMYTDNDIWLTYGQFIRLDGSIGFCHPMPEDIIANNAFREYLAPPSHLRTFYAGLFQKIKEDDLKLDHDFFPVTYDLAIMYPMLEMARDHFMFCPKPLLEFNDSNPLNDHKVAPDLQFACDRIIRSRNRYEKIESPF